MEICSIASGSSGNCIYVGNDDTHLLVDAGISGKRIEEGLNDIGLKTEEMDGILITHEHADHISSLGVLMRRYALPVYATKGTIQGIIESNSLGRVPEGLFREIKAGNSFSVNDLIVKPVDVSHDAMEPVAYRVESNGRSVGVCTDLGIYDEHIIEHFANMDALLLEANHDVNMLQVGRYPYYLKRRILGERGHLSNELSGKLLCRLLHDNLKCVFLGHLSAENNLAELAYETVRLEILMDECTYAPDDFKIKIAPRGERSEKIAV